MREPHVKERMQLAYRNALNAGLNGFPTVVLEHKGRRQFIAEGYTPFSTLEQRYRILIAGSVQID
jgi:protein-disulfide isomerase-like protein with CxxC motif